MYIEIRTLSAPQSFASASSEALLTQLAYHCRPCVLIPRNWIGRLYWLHRCTPQTWSWPLTATGVPPPPPPVVVFPVIRADFGDSLPAASYAVTVHWYVVSGVRPVTVNDVVGEVPT